MTFLFSKDSCSVVEKNREHQKIKQIETEQCHYYVTKLKKKYIYNVQLSNNLAFKFLNSVVAMFMLAYYNIVLLYNIYCHTEENCRYIVILCTVFHLLFSSLIDVYQLIIRHS